MTRNYIDPTLGADDGGPYADGFTSYTPTIGGSRGVGTIWSTAALAYSNSAGNGHEFWFRRGYFHDKTGTNLFTSFFTKSQCNVGAYGNAALAKPVLDGRTYYDPTAVADAANWTSAGNGTWYQEVAGASKEVRDFRTGVAASGSSKTTRLIGKYWAPAASVADLGPTRSGDRQSIWFSSTIAPYRTTVWTGSNTIGPCQYWGGLALSQPGVGVSNGLVCRNGAANVAFKDLEVRGTSVVGIGVGSLTTAGTTTISYDNVDLIACVKAAFGATGDGVSGYVVRGLQFTNGVIDMKSDNPESLDSAAIDTQNDDLIQFTDAVEGLLIYNIVVRCGTIHSVINGSPNVAVTQFPSQNVIGKIDILVNQYCIDGRIFGLDNCKGITVYGVKARGASTKSQVHGQDLTITACDLGPLAFNTDSSNQRFLIELTNFPTYIAPINRMVVNNVFRTEGAAFVKACVGVNTYSTAVAGVGINDLSLCNNLAFLEAGDGFAAFSPYNAAAQGINSYPSILTLSATTVGAGRTFTVSSATFAAGDVGKTIAAGVGRGTITAFGGASSVTVNITVAFPSSTVATNAWFMSANITLSSVAVGAGRTVAADFASFAVGDIGKYIVNGNGAGLGLITGFADASNITMTILTAFTATALAPGEWYRTTTQSIIPSQQIQNNYAARSDGSAAVLAAGNVSGDIQTLSFLLDRTLNNFMTSSGNLAGTHASTLTGVGSLAPFAGSPLNSAGLALITRTNAAGQSYVVNTRRDGYGAQFAVLPAIGAFDLTISRTART